MNSCLLQKKQHLFIRIKWMDHSLSEVRETITKPVFCISLIPSMAILTLGSNMLWSLWLALTQLWSLTQQEFQPSWKFLLTPVIHFVPVQILRTVSEAVSQVNTSPTCGDRNSQSVIQCFHQYPYRTAYAPGSSSCRSLTSPLFSWVPLCWQEIPAGNCFPAFHLRLRKMLTEGLMCKCEVICLNTYFFGQPCAVPCHSVKPH